MKRTELIKLRRLIEKASTSLNDDDALEAKELYPAWEVGMECKADERYYYSGDGKLYKCLQTHVTQEDWTPDVAVSLFVEVGKEGEIYPWKQPTADNPYMMGDRVYFPDYGDPIYVSLIDNNVWSPETYPQGWQIEEIE